MRQAILVDEIRSIQKEIDRGNISKALKRVAEFKVSVDRLIKDSYHEEILDEVDALQVELQSGSVP